jgi:hypothetical protein
MSIFAERGSSRAERTRAMGRKDSNPGRRSARAQRGRPSSSGSNPSSVTPSHHTPARQLHPSNTAVSRTRRPAGWAGGNRDISVRDPRRGVHALPVSAGSQRSRDRPRCFSVCPQVRQRRPPADRTRSPHDTHSYSSAPGLVSFGLMCSWWLPLLIISSLRVIKQYNHPSAARWAVVRFHAGRRVSSREPGIRLSSVRSSWHGRRAEGYRPRSGWGRPIRHGP